MPGHSAAKFNRFCDLRFEHVIFSLTRSVACCLAALRNCRHHLNDSKYLVPVSFSSGSLFFLSEFFTSMFFDRKECAKTLQRGGQKLRCGEDPSPGIRFRLWRRLWKSTGKLVRGLRERKTQSTTGGKRAGSVKTGDNELSSGKVSKEKSDCVGVESNFGAYSPGPRRRGSPAW